MKRKEWDIWFKGKIIAHGYTTKGPHTELVPLVDNIFLVVETKKKHPKLTAKAS